MASLRKRKRSKRALYWIQRRTKAKVEVATRKPNIIDGLPENLLLLEIFSKLRNPRDFVACKSVSKQWNSLISSSLNYNPSLALILNTEPQCATNDMCLEGWKGFDLHKYVDPEFDSPVFAVASCKDVLLCTKPSSEKLYIVNPMTMQWTRLPEHWIDPEINLPIGLIGNGTKGIYHVVMLFHSTSSMLTFNLFHSIHGKWSVITVQHPPWSQSGWCPTQYQGLVFKGALHWLAEDGPIVGYNPSDQNTCLLIHRSQEMRHASYACDAVVSETLTVSMGHLRIIQLVAAAADHHHHHHHSLYIWTLVDYKQSIWKQEHDPISFTDLPCLQDWTSSTQHNMSLLMSHFMSQPETRERILYPQPLCCHLYNPLLVYFCLPESIVSLDVATKKLQLVTRLSKRGTYWNQHDKVIPMAMHLDPSLVPDHGQVMQPRRKHRFFR